MTVDVATSEQLTPYNGPLSPGCAMFCCESRVSDAATLHLIGARLPLCSTMRAVISLLLLFAATGCAQETPIFRPTWGDPYCIPDPFTGINTCIVLPEGIGLENDRPDVKRKVERVKYLDSKYYSQNRRK